MDQITEKSEQAPKAVEDNIEDELQCTICLDIMYQPVTTPCGHSFCKQCFFDSLRVKKECTICRQPLFTDGSLPSLPTNITLQKIIERKYPDEYRRKESQVKQMQQKRQDDANKLVCLPVVVCDSFLYPGMRTIMTVDTRQLRDLLHVLTSPQHSAANQGNQTRKFVVVRKYSDMRGFVLHLEQVFNSQTSIKAQVIGQQRMVIDSVYVPPDRVGLYQDDQQALKFADGRIITDDDPFDHLRADIRSKVEATKAAESTPAEVELEIERQLLQRKAQTHRECVAKLEDVKELFSEAVASRSGGQENVSVQQTLSVFGPYPQISREGAIEKLRERMEKETLYVLSQLEMQNAQIDLIFQQSGIERLNACLAELERLKDKKYERLLVWEADPSIKRSEANWQFFWILIAVISLYLAGKYLR